MATPHSIERNAPATDAAASAKSASDITKAARFTLISIPRQTIGRLAIRYPHIGVTGTPYVAWATDKKCFYGPRFAEMDRFSQTFVMAHETLHHELAHIPHGAILFKRDPKGFSFKIYNIACDAIINWVLEHLPTPEQSKETIRVGVRKCQEMGIVNWEDICREMRQMAKRYGVELSPVFESKPNKLTSPQIYHAMMRVIRDVAAIRRANRRKQGWDELLSSLSALVQAAMADPGIVFRTAPLELGAVDLYDAIAHVVRTYGRTEAPADREGPSAIPEADWNALAALLGPLVGSAKDDPGHLFSEEPVRRSRHLWNDLAELVNAFRESKNDDGSESGDFDASGTDADEQSIIDRLADDLNAHDDLQEAIRKSSERGEGDLISEARRTEDNFRRVQAGAGSGDALMQVCPPDAVTKTPWHLATRRMLNSALISRLRVDPVRPSRRTVNQMYQAMRPGIRDEDRPPVIMNPRLLRNTKAKKAVLIIDTSGSIFCDKRLVARFLQEASSFCKRVNTTLVVVFADDGVTNVVAIGEAYDLIRDLEPKGGGGTSFVEALELADSMDPDVIVYLTDLCGTFPEKKPRKPVIWAYPPEFEDHSTPFGQRLPLNQ